VIPIESYSRAGTNEIAVTAASSGAHPLLFEAGTKRTRPREKPTREIGGTRDFGIAAARR
jgi:hypothetical protein